TSWPVPISIRPWRRSGRRFSRSCPSICIAATAPTTCTPTFTRNPGSPWADTAVWTWGPGPRRYMRGSRGKPRQAVTRTRSRRRRTRITSIEGDQLMKRIAIVTVLVVLCVATREVSAIDHTNLDEGRPLRLEDAYAIAHGEIAVEAGAGLTLQRRGPNRGVFPVELLYGALPNLQLGAATLFSTAPPPIHSLPNSRPP